MCIQFLHKLFVKVISTRSVIFVSLIPHTRPYIRTRHFRKASRWTPWKVIAIWHLSLLVACPLFGSDQHHTKSSTCTIYSSSRSVLQYRNAFYILRINKRQIGNFYTIYQNKSITTIQWGITTNVDISGFVGLTTIECNIQVGYHTLQTLCNITNWTVFQNLPWSCCNSSCQIKFLLCTITYDYHFIQRCRAFFKHNLQRTGFCRDPHFLRTKTNVRCY